MTFEKFEQMVVSAGLQARECSQIHWQILGGGRLVNIWPTTKRGFRMQAFGGAALAGTVSDAIALAGSPLSQDRARLEVGDETATDATTLQEYLEAQAVRYAEKTQAAFVEKARREGWLVKGTGTAKPPEGTMAAPWEGEQLGVIRRFWRWLW